jgi:hypothetical protein
MQAAIWVGKRGFGVVLDGEESVSRALWVEEKRVGQLRIESDIVIMLERLFVEV